MKRIYLFGLIVLVVGGVMWAYKTPTSGYFSPVEGEKIGNYDAVITDKVARATAYKQIEDIDKNTEVEKYFRLLAVAQNYSLLGEGYKAYATLLEAIELSPEKSAGFNMLGNVLANMGNLLSARESFEIAVEKESALFSNHTALASFLRQYFPADKDAIRRVYEYGIEKNSGNLTLRKEQAAWFEEIGEIKDAVEAWEVVYTYGQSPAVLDRIKALREQL